MEPTEVVTTVEPTIVEATPSEAQIVEQSTPMDSNVTYNNISEPTYNPGMEPVQNLINDAVTIEHDMNVANNAGKAMNNFLTNKYDYNKNEAGTYWVAGAINDTKTQMSFLQTLINEEMYDEMDLQKYYYDTNLATARAYAAQKEMETAYGFYRAAQEKALAEANLTGWYMPAEGQYLLGQYTAAQRTMEDPDATPDQLAKANRITKTAEEWFAANQITTRGIKCLSMLQFEETVRNNTVMAELEKEANQIAANQNAAASAMAALNLREFKFSVEEAELLAGRDYSSAIGLDDNKGYIGHHSDDYDLDLNLQGYDDTATMLADSPYWYNAVLTARGKTYVDNILKSAGYDAQGYYNYYSENAKLGSVYAEQTEAGTNNFNISEEDMNKLNVKTLEGKELYSFAGRVYAKNDQGVMEQVKQNIETSNGKTLAEVVSHFTTDTLKYEDKTFIAGDYSPEELVTGNEDKYAFLNDNQKKTIREYEAKGYHIKKGYISTQGIDADIVMENKDGDLIEVSDKYGKAQSIKLSQIKERTLKGTSFGEGENKAANTLVGMVGGDEDFSTGYSVSTRQIADGVTVGKTDKGYPIIKIEDSKGSTKYLIVGTTAGFSWHAEQMWSVYDVSDKAIEKYDLNKETTNSNPTYEPEIESATRTFSISYNEDYKSPSASSNKVSQKEAVDNLTNYDKNSNAIYGSTNKADMSFLKKEDADTSKEGWEKAVERAKAEASKTTTPVPTIIGEGKQGKTISDVQTELGRTPTKTFGEIFDAYSIPKNEREFLLKTYKTPESLERFLSNKYNGFLGTGG